MNKDIRKCLLLPSYEEIRMIDLCRNDIFELFESDGEYIGKFKAISDGYLGDSGVVTVDVEAG